MRIDLETAAPETIDALTRAATAARILDLLPSADALQAAEQLQALYANPAPTPMCTWHDYLGYKCTRTPVAIDTDNADFMVSCALHVDADFCERGDCVGIGTHTSFTDGPDGTVTLCDDCHSGRTHAAYLAAGREDAEGYVLAVDGRRVTETNAPGFPDITVQELLQDLRSHGWVPPVNETEEPTGDH